MRIAIWKYPLDVVDDQEIQMPSGSIPLCVKVQRGMPCMWAKVNVDNLLKPYTVYTIGTGHLKEEIRGKYVGTYLLYNGAFVGHVFIEESTKEGEE